VKLVFITPPSIAHDRVKNASRILKDAIDSMGLSDLDISPSTPGNSPAEKNHLKYANKDIRAEVWSGDKLKGLVNSFPAGSGLQLAGLGNPYRKDQWSRDKKTGQLVHSAAPKSSQTFTKIKNPE
jgi:phage protein D